MKTDRIKPADPEKRKAARERVKGWFDDPRRKPKPEDEPRNGTLPDDNDKQEDE